MPVILTLDPEVKKLWPGTVLGVMTWHASVHGVNPDLWTFYAESVQPGLFGKLQSTELSAMPAMSDNRRAFKSFGINPGRTRISSEALYRRVRQGKELYQVNAVVDANNLVSLSSGFSLGSYDMARTGQSVVLRLGREGETYAGIGKGGIKLHHMPVLCDGDGPFGSPGSDSRRAMVSDGAENIMTVIYGFSGRGPVEAALQEASTCFTRFAGASEIETALAE